MGTVLINPTLSGHSGARKVRAGGIGVWLASVCWLSRNNRIDVFPVGEAVGMGATDRIHSSLIDEGFWVDEGDRIHVPQWVKNKWSNAYIQLWKFGPLEGVRRKIPKGLRAAVYQRDGFSCLHCGSTKNLSLDHITPFSRGGPDTYENLQTLCQPCNSSKGARV